MNHLSDFQLNEYLDNILDPSARRTTEAHLIGCNECRSRLEELQSVLSTLKSLADVKLSHDISVNIASRLPPRREPALSPVFAVQLGAALGALLFITIELAQAVYIPPASTFQSLIPEAGFTIRSFQLSTLYARIRIINYFSLFHNTLFNLPQLPTFQFPLSNFQTPVVALLTILLWFVGNAILLHEQSEVRK